MKIDISEITNLTMTKQQGLSYCRIFSGTYKNEEVIIKMQEKTGKFSDERVTQEANVLKLNLKYVVDLIGEGETPDGKKFLVLEKLLAFPDKLSKNELQKILNKILCTFRKLYLKNIPWVPRPVYMGHILPDKNGIPKLLDFNDDALDSITFKDRLKEVDIELFFKNFCVSYGFENYQDFYNTAMTELIKEEFQSLENVHQPIYFEPYKEFQSKETEINSPIFGQLQHPGRICIDRAAVLDQILKDSYGTNRTCLDIGSNVGWFCFYLNELGLKMTGLDLDNPCTTRPKEWQNGYSGKIDFSKFLRDLKNLDVNFITADMDINYIKTMPNYDIILAFSVLHLYFNQHKYSIDAWVELFIELCKKVNHTLVYELAYIGDHFKISYDDFSEKVRKWGNFSFVELVRIKKSRRPILICKK